MAKIENVIILEEVTSTNEYLKLYYKQLPSGTVVIAKRQSNGKGRLSRKWMSELGNLYMSSLHKNQSRDVIFDTLMNVSVSVVRILKKYGLHAYIKYPNDIIVNGKKICGILIESMGFVTLDYLITGVGVNINQADFGDLNQKATSIFKETGKQIDVIEFSNELYEIIQEEKDVYKEYVIHSYVIGKRIYYQGNPYIVTGVNVDGSIKLSGLKEMNIPLNEISLEELYE